MFGIPSIAWRAGGALLVVAVLVGVFTLGHHRGRGAEYARIYPKVAAICEAAGARWELDAKGKQVKRGDQGKACRAAVEGLAKFRTDALVASQKAQREAQAEQDRKAEADQLAARRDAEAQREATRNMEKADAAVRDDRVDGAWLRALGELGGLRAPTP